MADLPPARLGPLSPPFLSTGVDCFDPLMITIGRPTEKRWGVIFKCMMTEAVHAELLSSLDSDVFLLAFRRLISCLSEGVLALSWQRLKKSSIPNLWDIPPQMWLTWTQLLPTCYSWGGFEFSCRLNDSHCIRLSLRTAAFSALCPTSLPCVSNKHVMFLYLFAFPFSLL